MSTGMILMPVIFVLGLAAIFFYCRNLFRAVTAFREKAYSVKLALRAVGIFFPVLGVFMGLV